MALSEDIKDIRRQYTKGSFSEKTADKDPNKQFKLWFEEAIKLDLIDPNAMVLSTADKNGRPSSRVVLLKNYDELGYYFYTNYESRKSEELMENPHASLLFYWAEFERQVRIEGTVEKITSEESFEYFKTRPYTSKLGAWASDQSRKLKSRFTLMRKVVKLMAKYPVKVPLPDFWGGFVLKPERFEFWQGRDSRLHDRVQYSRVNNSWESIRLYP